MNNILKTISILGIIIITLVNTLFEINNEITFILEIVFSSIFLFFLGIESSNKNKKEFIRYLIIFLIWNTTYFVIKDGIFISNSKVLSILLDSILLKKVYLNILPAVTLGYLISIFTNNKKFISIIFQIVLVSLSIFFKNVILLLCSVFLFGRLLNYKNKSTININLFNFFNKYNFIIYILHKFILDLLIYLNIVKYHSISDLFGSLIIIYIIGLIIGYYFIVFPIINKIAKA